MILLKGCTKTAVLANVHHAVFQKNSRHDHMCCARSCTKRGICSCKVWRPYKCFSFCHLSCGYFGPDPHQDVQATGDCRWNFNPKIRMPDLKISACLDVLKL